MFFDEVVSQMVNSFNSRCATVAREQQERGDRVTAASPVYDKPDTRKQLVDVAQSNAQHGAESSHKRQKVHAAATVAAGSGSARSSVEIHPSTKPSRVVPRVDQQAFW